MMTINSDMTISSTAKKIKCLSNWKDLRVLCSLNDIAVYLVYLNKFHSICKYSSKETFLQDFCEISIFKNFEES